jgi:hypothetical protein
MTLHLNRVTIQKSSVVVTFRHNPSMSSCHLTPAVLMFSCHWNPVVLMYSFLGPFLWLSYALFRRSSNRGQVITALGTVLTSEASATLVSFRRFSLNDSQFRLRALVDKLSRLLRLLTGQSQCRVPFTPSSMFLRRMLGGWEVYSGQTHVKAVLLWVTSGFMSSSEL